MLSVVSSLLASLSLALKQPLAGYCDVETTHGDALVTKQGDYCTFVRIGGMKRMATRDDITRLANGLRLDLSGALEAKGNAIVGWYLSDPDVAEREINRINMESCRHVGREVGLDLTDILAYSFSPISTRWPPWVTASMRKNWLRIEGHRDPHCQDT
jgi:intracellular multiplication protein IcmB